MRTVVLRAIAFLALLVSFSAEAQPLVVGTVPIFMALPEGRVILIKNIGNEPVHVTITASNHENATDKSPFLASGGTIQFERKNLNFVSAKLVDYGPSFEYGRIATLEVVGLDEMLPAEGGGDH